jgi:hypothetical protein
MIGEATPQELESMRRLMPGFVEAFHLVHLEEMGEFEVQSVLGKFAQFAQHNHKITIGKPALDLSYRLLSRFYPYESFPGIGSSHPSLVRSAQTCYWMSSGKLWC